MTAQAPAEHAAPALGSTHESPHAPQSAKVVCRLVSQPSLARPLQSPKPGRQRATVQAPAAQPSVSVLGSAHVVPHDPQLAGSTAVFAQKVDGAVPHVVSDAPQVVPHRPPEQTWPLGQVMPHPPQFALSVVVFTSHPSDALWSQSAKPVRHDATAQAPLVHVVTALASTHASPQAPQLVALVWVLVSHPLAAIPSQSPWPDAQRTTVHAPPEHPAVAVFARAHAFPQVPQLLGSTEVFAQKVGPVPQVDRGAPQVVPHAPPEHT